MRQFSKGFWLALCLTLLTLALFARVVPTFSSFVTGTQAWAEEDTDDSEDYTWPDDPEPSPEPETDEPYPEEPETEPEV